MENILSAALKSKCPYISARGKNQLQRLCMMPAKRNYSVGDFENIDKVDVLVYSGSATATAGDTGGATTGGLPGGSSPVSGPNPTNRADMSFEGIKYNALLRLADYKCPFVAVRGVGPHVMRQARSISTTAPPRAKIIANDLELLKKLNQESAMGAGFANSDGKSLLLLNLMFSPF